MEPSYQNFNTDASQWKALEDYIKTRVRDLGGKALSTSAWLVGDESFDEFLKAVAGEVLAAFTQGYEHGWNDAEHTFAPEPEDDDF